MQKQVVSPDMIKAFESVPDLYLILSPDLHILTASNTYLAATYTTRHKIKGKHVFKVFPDNPDTPSANSVANLQRSLQEVLSSGKAHKMPVQRYDIPKPAQLGGGFEEKYWQPINTPVLDDQEKVLFIIHKVSDVTEDILQQQNIEALQVANRQLHQHQLALEQQTVVLTEGMATRSQELQQAKALADRQSAQLEAIFQQAPIAIGIYTGPNHLVELINPQLSKIVGQPVENLIGKPLFEVLPELKVQGFEAILSDVYSSGVPYKALEVPATFLKEGEQRKGYYKLTYQPLINAEKQVTGILQISTDVSEQVEARERLKESTEKYHNLFERMDQGYCLLEMIFDKDNEPLDYRFLEVNPTFEKQTGLHNAIGKTALELVPDLEKSWFRIYGKVALTGQTLHFTEGSEAMGRWFDVYAYRMGGDDSRKVALLFTDITDRIKNEQALRESEDRFRTIANASPIALWMSDQEGNITHVNETWISWTGRPFEAHLNMGWADSILPEDREKARTKFKEDFAARRYFEVDFRIINATGEVRWCIDNGQPYHDIKGNFAGYAGSCVDITERKLAEQSVLQKNEQLKRINADLDNFIYTASHDLRAPIINIEGLMNVVYSTFSAEYKKDEKVGTLLGMIYKSIDRFKDTIKDLTEIAKVQHNGEEDLSEISFEEMLEDVQLNIKSIIDTSQAQIHEDFSQAPTIYFSKKNLRSILYNLVSNAIKYRSPDRDPVVHITTSRTDNNHILLSVKDNGLGIKEQDKQKVFKMFTRLHLHVEGTGVGMSIVKKIVDNNEGYIEIDSEVGKGSTFSIYLNTKKAARSPISAPKQVSEAKQKSLH